VADPNEDQPSGAPEAIAPGEQLRGEFLKDNERARARFEKPRSMDVPLDPEVTDKLRRLGYIE